MQSYWPLLACGEQLKFSLQVILPSYFNVCSACTGTLKTTRTRVSTWNISICRISVLSLQAQAGSGRSLSEASESVERTPVKFDHRRRLTRRKLCYLLLYWTTFLPLQWCRLSCMYTVWVKKVAPPPKLFAIFSLGLSIFPWNFCQYVASLYLHKFTNFGRFVLIWRQFF